MNLENFTPEMLEKFHSDQRVVVCAANRYGDNLAIGVRHFDYLMRNNINLINRVFRDMGIGEIDNGEWEQGFICQFGIFMTREEALLVAQKSGQLDGKVKCHPIDQLFSEDLY